MRRVMCLVVVGCGGSVAPDTTDAGVVDASIDARAACGPADDGDGDGVCNAIDVCPDEADPLQFDLDGDGRGWACDDNESLVVPVPATATFGGSAGVGRADLFGASFRFWCGEELCSSPVALVVSPSVAYVGRHDPGTGAHAWLAMPSLDGPVHTDDGELVFVRGTGFFDQEMGRFDPASEVFAPYPGLLHPRHVRNRAGDVLLLAFEPTPAMATLYEPVAGVPPRLVASAERFEDASEAGAQVIEGADPLIVVPERTGATYRLKTFRRGQQTLEDVTVGPWSHLSLIKRRDDIVYYCGRRQDTGTFEDIIVTQADVVAHPFPFATCPAPSAFIDAGLVLQGRDPTSGRASLIVHSPTQALDLIMNEPTLGMTLDDGDPIFVDYAEAGPNYERSAWIVRRDGSVTPVGRDLRSLTLARAPGMLTATFMRADSTPFGSSVHFQRHPAAGTSDGGVFMANVNSAADSMFIAHDGTLFVVWRRALYSISPGTTDVVEARSSVLYAHCARTPNVTLCGITPSLGEKYVYAYRDGTWEPISPGTVTPLARDGDEDIPFVLVFPDSSNNGPIVHVDASPLGVSLEPLFSMNGGATALGHDPSGRLLARFYSPDTMMVEVAAFDATTGQLIARSLQDLELVYERFPGPIVGLKGRDAAGAYLVSTIAPDRCWIIPYGGPAWREFHAGAPDELGFTEVFTVVTGGEATLSILRPRRHPDRSPPI